jgi:hypothetical protein
MMMQSGRPPDPTPSTDEQAGGDRNDHLVKYSIFRYAEQVEPVMLRFAADDTVTLWAAVNRDTCRGHDPGAGALVLGGMEPCLPNIFA